jgi:hypothetical protein
VTVQVELAPEIRLAGEHSSEDKLGWLPPVEADPELMANAEKIPPPVGDWPHVAAVPDAAFASYATAFASMASKSNSVYGEAMLA